MNRSKFQGLLLGLVIGFIVLVSAIGGALADRLFVIKPLDFLTARNEAEGFRVGTIEQKVLNETYKKSLRKKPTRL